MRRRAVERALRSNGPHEDVVEPAYGDYCISNVTESLLSLLSSSFDAPLPDDAFRGVETDVDAIVFVLLDGFGYDAWTRFEERASLPRRFDAHGAVTPLTSIYPSETAAAFTSIHTGRPPIEHGLLGWFQYLDAIDRDVVTLPFTALDGTPLQELEPDLDGTALFDATPLSTLAADAGIAVETILPDSIVESAYSRAIFEGATRRGYAESATFADRIRETVEAADGPTLVHAYEPSIDAAAHTDGLGSDRCRATIDDVLTCLRSSFVDDLAPSTAERTLLVVAADHGLLDTPSGENVDVRDWACWPELQETFRTDGSGTARAPTGSPRNVHVHVRPDRIERARVLLEDAVDGLVRTRVGAVDAGLFGRGSPSDLFERRCGDVIAVHRNRGLCWHDDALDVIGRHGGLTRAEMLVPLAAGRVDALQS